MPDSKEEYYRSQLQSALTAGHWNSDSPAKSTKGTFISWSELFRKLKKHGKKPETSEAATQAHFLSLLLETTQLTSKAQITGEKNDEKITVFSLGDECVIREGRQEDAQRAYDSLLQLGSSDEYSKLILAFLAYALGRPSECLDLVKDISFESQLNTSKPALVVTSTEDQSSAHVTATDVNKGDAWVLMEAIRTNCLEGMSHERISPGSPSQALAAYDKGIALLRSYTISKTQPSRSGRGSFESFRQYNELWTWTERLLWRTIALSGQHRSIERTLAVFRTYSMHSEHWPPSFQSHHRSLICSLYLRALMRSTPQSNAFGMRMDLLEEVRTVVNEYRDILNVTTSFPKAGEHNVLVEEFVDLCVAVWEAGGAMNDQATWVIDILWWATRLTFNSPRILRHMFRLLHIAGDDDLAKRVLRLYVQVVKKARQTGTVDVQGHETHDTLAMESDTIWVQTLVQGIRMLCRMPKDVEDVREAETLVELARERFANLSEEMQASVDLADGICRSVLALKENNPETRGSLLSSSIGLLSRSVEKHTTSSGLYHLALGLSRATPERDLAKAIDLCRGAVELEPNEIRNWHLLALLLSKQGEWKKAKGVIEAAIEIANDVETRFQLNDLSSNGVTSPDSGNPNQSQVGGVENGMSTKTGSIPLIACNTKALAHASSLLMPMPDHPPTSHRDLFDQVFQLRMTQIVVIEHTEGPDSVEASWIEVFEWYSQRRDVGAHTVTRTPSIDTRRSLSPMPNEVSEPMQSTVSSVDIASHTISTTQEGLTPQASQDTIDPSDAATIRSMRQMPEGAISANAPQSSKPTSNGETGEGTRTSVDSQRSDGRGKRMQQILKDQVHKQQARITSMSKKLHYSASRNNVDLPRSSSAPDLQEVLARAGPYQASSIHSRRRISLSSRIHGISHSTRHQDSPPPLPPLPNMTQQQGQTSSGLTIRSPRERRLLSDLWLMSAATFRRLERLDQARCAIQEAEQIDAENVSVWVQFALYLSALGDDLKAVESYNKALFIEQDSIPATVHLARLFLMSSSARIRSKEYGALSGAVGMLEALTRGAGWDVAEAWYLLAKGYGMQGRKVRQRECLVFAMGLAEVRGVRDVNDAIGLCL